MTQTHTTSRRELLRAAGLVGLGGTFGGLVLSRLTADGPSARAQDDAAPTQTRTAELAEVHNLQTRVAQPVECTHAATETPVPATATATVVPAAAVGTPLAYGDRLTITVLGIAPIPVGGDYRPRGQLLRVNLTVLNTTRDAAVMPFAEWLLIDASGRPYEVSSEASNAIVGGWGVPIRSGASEDRAVIFDVEPDAGTTFVLESRDEPTFRVALAIESRG